MTKTVDADPEPAALAVPRPGSAIWIPWFGWLIEAGLLIDLVHRGNMTDLLNYAPWLLLVGWAIWVLLWAPRLLVYRDRVEVIEPLRCFRLPFHRITDVRLGVALRIDYTDASGRARRLRPWNAPARRDFFIAHNFSFFRKTAQHFRIPSRKNLSIYPFFEVKIHQTKGRLSR